MSEAKETYRLGEPFVDGRSLEIGYGRYQKLCETKGRLNAISRIDIAYNIFRESVVDFEKLLLDATFENFFDSSNSLGESLQARVYFDRLRTKINVRMISLLSAAKAYHAQRARALNAIDPSGGFRSCADKMFSKFYDFSLNYRVMEALRNYSQHAGIPIETLTVTGKNRFRDSSVHGSPSVFRSTIEPHILKKNLLLDKDFKRAVAAELEGIKESKLDVRSLVRSYLSMISYGNGEVRKLIRPVLDEAERELVGAAEECRSYLGEEKIQHLSAWKSGAKVSGEVYLDQEIVDEIRHAWQNDSGSKWLRRGYVSTELSAHRDVYIGEYDDVWIE